MKHLALGLLGLFGGFVIGLTLTVVVRMATGTPELTGAWTLVPEGAAILGAVALPTTSLLWRRR